MMTTSNSEGMLSVSVPQLVMPQFQLLMKLAQLRRQSVDVAKILAGYLEKTIQNQDFAEQVEGAQACNEPEGDNQGEDSVAQPTEEATVTTFPGVKDADDSDLQELSANLKVKAELRFWANDAGSLGGDLVMN